MSNESLRLGRHPSLIAHRSSLARALSGYLRAYQLQAALLWALRLLTLGLALDLLALGLARAWPLLAPPAAPYVAMTAEPGFVRVSDVKRLCWTGNIRVPIV